MITIRILFVAFLGFSFAQAAERADPRDNSYLGIPIIKDVRAKFVLFSWRGRDGVFRYALMPNNREKLHGFLDSFNPNRPGVIRLDDLEKELTKLPKRSLVTWMRDVPNGVTYPKPAVVRRVKKFARRMHLDLQFNETRYEQPGV